MNITNKQLTSPKVLEVGEVYRRKLEKYKKSVKNAKFLNESEKRRWILLGYILSEAQLSEAENLIISEDLRIMNIKQQLEVIKPNPDPKHMEAIKPNPKHNV